MSELEDSRNSARQWKQVAFASWIVIAIMGFLSWPLSGRGNADFHPSPSHGREMAEWPIRQEMASRAEAKG